MVVVVKKKGESKESLIRRFMRIFLDEEIVETLREKMFYKKPSIIKKEKKKRQR